MKFLYIFNIIFVISTMNYSIAQQVLPKLKYAENQPQYKPLDLELLKKILCQKTLEIEIEKAGSTLEKAIDDTLSGFVQTVTFDNSSWLTAAGSFSYIGVEYSFIFTKEGNLYFFQYIPLNILERWKGSLSAGDYYHEFIRDQYTLTDCIDYAP